jgi:hypothetical protein
MKIRFLQSYSEAGQGYVTGLDYYLIPEMARPLVNAGIAEVSPDPEPELELPDEYSAAALPTIAKKRKGKNKQ